ncbi:MAG: hypothetical protein AAGU78_11805 [Chloroflexota bacterium]|jgi:hypothetical protein|nr:hypothetical protein [Anaerolineae bacterium]HMM27353.1 hypothetical protein [Aggregatilineaceae bacterium]
MTRLNTWEKWVYRVSFVVLALFLIVGALVIEDPTEARTDAFGLILYATLIAGIASGMVTIMISSRRR